MIVVRRFQGCPQQRFSRRRHAGEPLSGRRHVGKPFSRRRYVGPMASGRANGRSAACIRYAKTGRLSRDAHHVPGECARRPACWAVGKGSACTCLRRLSSIVPRPKGDERPDEAPPLEVQPEIKNVAARMPAESSPTAGIILRARPDDRRSAAFFMPQHPLPNVRVPCTLPPAAQGLSLTSTH